MKASTVNDRTFNQDSVSAAGRESDGFRVNQQARDVIMGWDLESPKRLLVERHGFDEAFVERLDKEYRKYLILRASHPELPMPISAHVDELWHAHVLFTQDYAELCNELGRFLHHKPVENEEEQAWQDEWYDKNTMSVYRDFFGDPPKDLWPPKLAVCGGNGSFGV